MHPLALVCCLAAGLCVVSAVLIRAPPLPWTRRRQPWPHDTRRIAHRGGSLIGPENTMLTFRRATASGLVDMIELDVCLTADGEVVVAHDASLIRVCGVAGSIPTTALADLPRLARRIPLHFTGPGVEAWEASAEEWAAEGPQAMPTLREVFEAFPDMPMHVDAKYQSEELAAKTVAIVREYSREGNTIVGSARQGNADLIRTLWRTGGRTVANGGPPSANKDAAPTADEVSTPLAAQRVGSAFAAAENGAPLYTFACAEEVAKAYVLYYLGLLPLVPVAYDAFDIPLPTKHLRDVFNRPYIAWLLDTPKLWRHLQARGVKVYGFVVNSEADFAEARDWPVDGVMTDDPRFFARTPWLVPTGKRRPT